MANTESIPEVPAAASDLVAACEEAWQSIQSQHAEVPDVVVVLGTGVERGRLVKLGHWWGGRWMADGQLRGEVLLAGEALHLQPSQVFEVLLHESTHGLNAARGIKDVSRGGRYHNARFKVAAEELGLVVSSMPPYGWAQTALGPTALKRYESDISRLGDTMRIARRLSADVRIGESGSDQDKAQVEGDGMTSGEGPAKAGPAVCACGRKMRMAPSVLAQGPVLCGLCGQEFATGQHASRRTQQYQAASIGGTGEPEDDETRRSGLDHLTKLAAEPRGVSLIAELGAWREAQRQGDPRPIVATTDAELREANNAARALLKLEGDLFGSPMVIADQEVLIGDLLVIGVHDAPLHDLDGRELPPPCVLGTVVDLDPAGGMFEVDFAIAGRHRIDVTSAAAAALDYGYAERVAFVGAPFVDLRTLPEFDRASAVDPVAVAELSW